MTFRCQCSAPFASTLPNSDIPDKGVSPAWDFLAKSEVTDQLEDRFSWNQVSALALISHMSQRDRPLTLFYRSGRLLSIWSSLCFLCSLNSIASDSGTAIFRQTVLNFKQRPVVRMLTNRFSSSYVIGHIGLIGTMWIVRKEIPIFVGLNNARKVN